MRGAVLVLLALALGVSVAPVAAAPASVPKLRISTLSPLTVRGTGFAPGERVKLLVTAPGPSSRSVRASAKGAFTVSLGIRVGRCVRVAVQAIGSRRSRAEAELLQPDCAPIPG